MKPCGWFLKFLNIVIKRCDGHLFMMMYFGDVRFIVGFIVGFIYIFYSVSVREENNLRQILFQINSSKHTRKQTTSQVVYV